MSGRLRESFGLLWRYPAFCRLWVGRTVTLFGDGFALVALPWIVLQTTGSGAAAAGILLALQLPAIVSSLAIGSWLDRFQPRAIMAIDNGLRIFIVALIPILYWRGMLPLGLLFVLTVLMGLLEPATTVGSRSILPDLVEDRDLDGANMLWSFSNNLALVAGPAAAGVLVAALGAPGVLVLDAATFAVMALAALTLPRLERGRPAAPAPLTERLGLHQLWHMKAVRLTTLLSLVFFLAYGPLEAALPLYSAAVLKTDAAGYGLLWSSLAAGALLGTLASGPLGRRVRLGVALPLIALLWGASLLPIVFVDTLWPACAFLLLGGLVWGPYTPLETTLLQRVVPRAQLGRVFGARSTLLTGGTPLGLALGGALLTVLPSTGVIALSAAACILVGLVGLVSPAFRGLSLAPTRSKESEPRGSTIE